MLECFAIPASPQGRLVLYYEEARYLYSGGLEPCAAILGDAAREKAVNARQQ